MWLFFWLFSIVASFQYLDNNNTSFDWLDIPENSILNENIYPYNGIGCSTYSENDVYFITSSNPLRYSHNQKYCGRTKRYVEILKYNLISNVFTNNLLIGDATGTYPHAIGGMGNNGIMTISQKDSKINDDSILFGENIEQNKNQKHFRFI